MLNESYYLVQIEVLEHGIAAAKVHAPDKVAGLQKRLELSRVALAALTSGPLHSPHPFDGLLVVADLGNEDSSCITGRHRTSPFSLDRKSESNE
jgi:hypothetical protein